MQRLALIQQIQREVSGGNITDDSNFTDGLVNQLIEQGIALAAKQNYKENIQIEGIGVLNNGFYTTFKGIAVVRDEKFLWKTSLPQIPVGIGTTEGVSAARLKSSDGKISMPVVLLSENQVGFSGNMRPIPNKLLGYTEGGDLYIISEILLNPYTLSVTMVSGGDSTDLTSELNVPNDFINVIVQYCVQQLLIQKNQPQDLAIDGNNVV